MAHNVLRAAAELLRKYYGMRPEPSPPGEWRTLVRIVLERCGSAKKGRDFSWIEGSPIRSPVETASLTADRLAEILDAVGPGGNPAGVLPALAQWWLCRVGDEDAPAVFAQRPLAAWQEDLRAIRGVSWDLADRILLFVAGLPVYPLDRGSLRIAARHAWMDLAAEYDEWQAFFVGSLREADVDLADMSYWYARLARDFCGVRAKCEECPLKELLSERGPVLLEDVD